MKLLWVKVASERNGHLEWMIHGLSGLCASFNTVQWKKKRSSTKETMDESVKSKQVRNGLYFAAADNDTAFSYVTDRSEARTVLPRCYSTSIHTTNTELCSGVNTIWYCSSSQPNMWPITLTGCVPSLQPIGLRQRNCTRTKLAMLRCCEWLVIVFIGSDFKLQHSVPYRIVYFRNVNPCSLANSYQLFRVLCCLHFLSWRWWQQDSTRERKLSSASLYNTNLTWIALRSKPAIVQKGWALTEWKIGSLVVNSW